MSLSKTSQKFRPVNLSTTNLRRPQLESVLRKGLNKKARLISIIAPAGYGKSTLAASWIQENHIQNIWINIDSADNDTARFYSVIQQALDGKVANAPKGATPHYDAARAVNAISERFIQQNKSTVLVFDCLENINNPEILKLIISLVTQLPLNVSTLILSRKDPSLPISRMRAHNQLIEINEPDMRFSKKETKQFLEIHDLVNIDSTVLDHLYQKTFGWPVGLRLTVDLLGKELSKDNSLTVQKINGSHRYFSEYFNEEIYSKLEPDTASFMQNSCILDQFSASLCRSVFDIENAADQIGSLIDNQFFTLPVENKPDWYHYHPLFQDFLRSTIKSHTKSVIYQKTAEWFEGQGELHTAVDYGFRSGNESIAIKIIEPACEKVMLDGNIETIEKWMENWAKRGFPKRSELLAYQGWIKALHGDFVQALLLEEQARETLAKQNKTKEKIVKQNLQITQGKLAALKAFIEVMYGRQYDAAAKQVKIALKLLPGNRSAWNLMALWAQAETQKRTNHISKAVETLYEALRIGKSVSGKIFQYAIVSSLAAALHFNGQRKEALSVCQKTLLQSSDKLDPLLGGVYSWIGRLYLESNQLEQSLAYIQKGIRLNEQVGVNLNLIFSYHYASQIYQALGQSENALSSIHHAQQLAGNASLADESWLNAWEANCHLTQGNIMQIEHWIRREGPALEQRPDYLNAEMLTVYARYLIRKGEINLAAKRLQALERFCSKKGYYRWLLTIHLLQAIVCEKKGKKPQALAHVKRALIIAAPEEYQHAILEEDALILNLIQELSAESPAFIMRVLRSASSKNKEKVEIPVSILPEPLSERETQVLKLLASGKKGPQIALELFIAYSTVRTHLKSIHRKLDVHNRQELIEKARLLELI